MSNPTPKKVVLHADTNFIQHLYAEHEKEYKHYPTCSFSTNNNDANTKSQRQTNKTSERINRRVTKFYQFFDPMMNFLLMNRYALYNKQSNIDVETMPTEYIIVVHLIDCPSDTGRPQLCIEKLEPRLVEELNAVELAALKCDLSSNNTDNNSSNDENDINSNNNNNDDGEQSSPAEQTFHLPHMVSYTTPQGQTWTSIRTNTYDYNPLIIGRVSQKALMGRLIAFAQGINEIIRGERMDLYELIKREMSQSRRRRVRGVEGGRRLDEEDKENCDPNLSSAKNSSRGGGGNGMKKRMVLGQRMVGNEEKKVGTSKDVQ